MENSIEEDITKINTYVELVLKKDYCNCNELNTILGKHCDGSKNVAYAMQHILSAYRRVLKENEKLRVKWDKDTHILQNKLDYANADRIDLAQQNKELRKENEELNNRCRNLDKEAQAYLEELAGDNTLTRRTIKQLQEENEELKIKNNAIKRESEAYTEHMIRLDNELNLEKEKSKYEWIRQNCLSQELVNKLYIPIQKVKDKIEQLEKNELFGKYNFEQIKFAVDALQELLEGGE